jgi:hypothetical protein
VLAVAFAAGWFGQRELGSGSSVPNWLRDEFNVRDFHDALLVGGPLPLALPA